MDFDKQLEKLQESIYRKRRLDSKLKSLRKQEGELAEKEQVYRRMYLLEQADVDALQGKSLGAFFARLFTSQKEKLSREEAEAAAALAKYQTALEELSAVRAQVGLLEKEYRYIRRSEEEYEQCLDAKREYLVEQKGETADQIVEMEQKIGGLQEQIRELEEAITAGRRAKNVLCDVERELDSAEGLGAWDMWGGGGFWTDAAKYSHLDKASDMVHSLQKMLREFRTELADVDITEDLQIEIDSFTRFADFFWDGFFVDWKVLREIRDAQWNCEQLERNIQDVLDILLARKERLTKEADTEQYMLEKKILQG